VPDRRFNAVHGAQRLIFNDARGSFHMAVSTGERNGL
jgi:hypothetical protein